MGGPRFRRLGAGIRSRRCAARIIAGMDASIGERLGYHVIRRVAPPESPFAGVLARDDTGETVLLAAVGGAEGWDPGWEAGAGEHRLIPRDVLAREGGNEVVLPWCVERVDAFVSRRHRVGAPLRAGEAVTIAVCVLRGASECLAHAEAAGAWWLSADGRPVFARHGAPARAARPGDAALREGSVSGSGADAVRSAHTAAFGAVAAASQDSGIAAAILECAARLSESAAADRDRAPARWSANVRATLRMCEDELFARASAEPLDTRSLSPRTSRSLQLGFDELLGERARDGDAPPERERAAWRAPRGGRGPARREDGPARREDAPLRRAVRFVAGQLRDATARHVDPEIAEVAADTWRRTRGGAGRAVKRPIAVGAVLAAVVVTVGVMWPDDGGREPRASVSSAETSAGGAHSGGARSPGEAGHADGASGLPVPAGAGADAASTARSDAPGAVVDDDDDAPEVGIAGVADALLAARGACAEIAACAPSVYEDAGAAARVGPPQVGALATRAIDVEPTAREAALVDDLGGVAVIRVTPRAVDAGVSAQMLVIVQTERGWRIRDVFDVSDAPPTGER